MKFILFLSIIFCFHISHSQFIEHNENLRINQHNTKESEFSIHTSSNLDSGARGVYMSEKNIRFSKGFRARKGSNFKASIRKGERPEILSAYPNPVMDEVNIEFWIENDFPPELYITSNLGVKLEKIDVGNNLKKGFNRKAINFERYVAGIYYIIYSSKNANKSIKIFKL